MVRVGAHGTGQNKDMGFLTPVKNDLFPLGCQSALKIDPVFALNFDPLET